MPCTILYHRKSSLNVACTSHNIENVSELNINVVCQMYSSIQYVLIDS